MYIIIALRDCRPFYFIGLSLESVGEGIVVSSAEEGRLAHVQGTARSKTGFVLDAIK